ncbi:MAG: Panacea domain-containing protein [Prosthecobacter sp.]
MQTVFDIDKAAQVAHFFVSSEGGEMDILKLVKLIYLADRASLQSRRTPIVGGAFYSLKHGPVTEEVLDLINDGTPGTDSPWERLISDRANHRLAVREPLLEYDALSVSEMGVLKEVWKRFGQHGKWELVTWTHQHCEEWSDPRGGRIEISARRLAESFGWKSQEIDDFITGTESRHRLHQLVN